MFRHQIVLFALVLAVLSSAQVPAGEWRSWTPRFPTLPSFTNQEGQRVAVIAAPSTVSDGDRFGVGYITGSQPFQARLLRIQGEENRGSVKYAVLELRSGSVRAWPVRSFSAADQAYLAQAEVTQERLVDASFTPFDGLRVPYAARYEVYRPDDPSVITNATDHFLFYWGAPVPGTTVSGSAWYDVNFRTRTFQYFEEVWKFYAKELNVTMPWASPETSDGGSGRFKINVFVTGTGLARHPDGFAFGGREILIHPAALAEGSSVVAHEFGHVLQYYSRGFRNNDFVGWFWECHANWLSHQFIPSYPPALEVYLRRKTHELPSTRMNYGSWVFLQVIREDPRFPSSFTTDIWKNNLKRPDTGSLETPLETIRRLGRSVGAFKIGDGTEEFGDLIGTLAAKMAYFDLAFRQTYTDFLTRTRWSDQLYLLHTPVEAVPDRANWFRPLVSHQPWQYGVNQIPLTLVSPRPSNLVVQLNFLLPEAHADWRASLAVESADGSIRYSSVQICQQCSTSQASVRSAPGLDRILFVKLNSDDRSAFLTVSASPKIMERLGFRAGFHRKNGYAYEFTVLRGATVSASTPTWSPRLNGRPGGAAHPNGGGFVASSARVAATAFVGSNALVLGNARVSDFARIEDFAIVNDDVTVSGNAVVSGYAWVNGRAQISGTARVRDFSRVQGQVVVSGDAAVYGQSILNGRGEFRGNAVSKDLSAVVMIDGQVVNGSTLIARDAEFYTAARPTVKGRFYDFSSEDNNNPQRQNLPASDLVADFSFNLRRGVVLKDEYSSNDGFLRGRVDYEGVDNRTTLRFPNSSDDAYATLSGYLLDSSQFSVEISFRHLNALTSETVFLSLFTRDRRSGLELGIDAAGRLRWSLTAAGNTTQVVSQERASNASRWYNIRFESTVEYNGTSCIWNLSTFSGAIRLILSQRSVQVPREACSDLSKISSGVLGRSLVSSVRFYGWIDHLRIYRRVFGTTLPPSPPGADGTNLASLNYGIVNSQRVIPATPANLDSLIPQNATSAAPAPTLRMLPSDLKLQSGFGKTTVIVVSGVLCAAVVVLAVAGVIYAGRQRRQEELRVDLL